VENYKGNAMKLILSILISLSALSVFAEEFESNKATKEGQWSLGYQVGAGDANGQLVDTDTLNFGFELGYSINENFGVKLGGVGGSDGLSSFFLESLGLDVEDYVFGTIYLAATARTSSPLYVFGSLGLASTSETIEVNNGSDLEDDSTSVYFDVGVGWDIGEHFSLSAYYSKTNAEFADISSTYIQATYRF